MRASRTEAAGTSGQSYVKALLEASGWAVVPNPEHDLGTDLWVCPRDPRRFDLGLMLGVQVKNGKSYFGDAGEHDGRRGWWHSEDRSHLEHWSGHAVPHILVLRDPTTAATYWTRVRADDVVWTGVNGKVFVPASQTLDGSALPALIDVAAAAKPAPRWAGSAWTGAGDVPPADGLRYALLVPRLMAPHPNAGSKHPDAPAAIALLTSGRFGELDRYRLLDDESTRDGWPWRLFVALRDQLMSGSLDALRGCVATAVEPHEAAAATAVLAALLVEEGAYQEALDLMNRTLEADRCSPVDHAWLVVHQARCLAECGDPGQAIELAVSVQGLPAVAPDDVTAAAIAGAGATLVFQTSGIAEGDVATTITAIDTEASWWRSQALGWGLDSLFDDAFRRWARNDDEVRFGAADPTNRIRGASLVDGFTASHDGWCHTMALLAKAKLVAGGESIEDATWWLTALRRTGDTNGVKAAVSQILELGPAQAVRDAAELVDLDQLAHTEARASLELIIRGADVLNTSAADAAARWAIQDRLDADRWAGRVRPTFLVKHQRAAVIGAVFANLSPDMRNAVRAFIVALPPLDNQGDANAWARVIVSVPIDEWTDHEVAALLDRTGDNWELVDAIKAIGLQNDAPLRAANDDALRAGSLQALQWVASITAVPPDAVGAVVAAAGQSIRHELAQARSGAYGFGVKVDPGQVLVLANTAFPADADWEPVLELLAEPRATKSMLEGALAAIASHPEGIPHGLRPAISQALVGILRRPPHLSLPFVGGDPGPAAQAALEAVAPDVASVADWTTIRDWQGRRQMCLSIARRADPADAHVLATLAGDPDPRIRGAAAQALSHWLTRNIAADLALEVLQRVVADSGTYVARRVISEWPDESTPRLRALAETLADHPSAAVRAAARRMMR